jgi:hypothetical protein
MTSHDDHSLSHRPLTEEENAQAIAMIMQTARVPREHVMAGAYLPYIDITSENKSLLSGGDLAMFAFDLDGASFAVVDSYCLNPEMACEEVLLDFFRFGEGTKPGRCTFTAPFQGEAVLLDRLEVTEEEASNILKRWEEVRPEWFDEKEIRERCRAIKEVGKRSLTPLTAQAEEGVPTPLAQSDAPRVRRNDLCPCGSGKKYKKCCLKR